MMVERRILPPFETISFAEGAQGQNARRFRGGIIEDPDIDENPWE